MQKSNRIFKISNNILTGVSIYLIILGMCIPFFPQSSFLKWLFNDRIDYVFWANNALPQSYI